MIDCCLADVCGFLMCLFSACVPHAMGIDHVIRKAASDWSIRSVYITYDMCL